jgi:hypothetical protein
LFVVVTSREPVAGLTGVHEVRLGPLDRREVAEYLGLHEEAERVSVILQHSGGIPLYVREIARVTDLSAPIDLVRHQFAGLSSACDRLLDGAAVLGDDVDVAVLQADRATVAEAVRAGVLVNDPSSPETVRWSHALIRPALLTGPDRVVVHRVEKVTRG